MLTVICGPMFAGKTSTLLRQIGDARDATIFKPAIDNRWGADSEIVSHDGARAAAVPVVFEGPWAGEMLNRAGWASTVVIDEAQFFPPEICDVVAKMSRWADVFVAGLDLDSRGLDFGSMPALTLMADKVIRLRARCEICGGSAAFTYRKADVEQTVAVGGSEMYAPRCGEHWMPR